MYDHGFDKACPSGNHMIDWHSSMFLDEEEQPEIIEVECDCGKVFETERERNHEYKCPVCSEIIWFDGTELIARGD